MLALNLTEYESMRTKLHAGCRLSLESEFLDGQGLASHSVPAQTTERLKNFRTLTLLLVENSNAH